MFKILLLFMISTFSCQALAFNFQARIKKLFNSDIHPSSLKPFRFGEKKVGIAPSFDVITMENSKLTGDLGAHILGPSTTENEDLDRKRLEVGIGVIQNINGFKILGRAHYGVETQESTLKTKSIEELGLSIGVFWNF
jgi:hypothetical protein